MVWLSPKLNNLVVNKLYLHEAEGDREDSSRCPGAVHCAGGWLGGWVNSGYSIQVRSVRFTEQDPHLAPRPFNQP